MKKTLLLSFLMVILSSPVVAAEKYPPLPAVLKGAVVTVSWPDGSKKDWQCKSEDCAVIFRQSQPTDPVVIADTVELAKAAPARPEPRLYRLGLWGGAAQTGLESSSKGSSVTIKGDVRAVVGLSFGQQFEDSSWGYELVGFVSRTPEHKLKAVLGAVSLQHYW